LSFDWHAAPLDLPSFPTRRSSDLLRNSSSFFENAANPGGLVSGPAGLSEDDADKLQTFFNTNFTGEKSGKIAVIGADLKFTPFRSEEHTSELQSRENLVCRLLLEK